MRIVGHKALPLPALLPHAAGLAAARSHQLTGAALAAVASTGIRFGIYRFASHQAMNRADEDALVSVVRVNAEAQLGRVVRAPSSP